jgi:predicted nucleic acid-binding Zn ribbon protein
MPQDYQQRLELIRSIGGLERHEWDRFNDTLTREQNRKRQSRRYLMFSLLVIVALSVFLLQRWNV